MYANYFNVSSDYITKLFDENSSINRDDLDMMFMFLYTKKGYLKSMNLHIINIMILHLFKWKNLIFTRRKEKTTNDYRNLNDMKEVYK